MGLVDDCRIFISEGMETVVVATRSDATDKRSGKCMIVQVSLVFEIDRKF